MSFSFRVIVDLLTKLGQTELSPPKYKILVTILKAFPSQEIPVLCTAASAFEASNNISSDSQVAARSTSNAIYLEYQLSENEICNILGKPPRILINGSSFKC
jgi:hypothetical protein